MLASMLVPRRCAGAAAALARRGEPLCVGCRRLLRRARTRAGAPSGVRVWAPVAYAGPGARPGPRAEVPRRDRGGRRDGRADRRERPRRSMLEGSLVPVPAAPAPAAAPRLQPGRPDRGRAGAPDRSRGGRLPRRAPGRPPRQVGRDRAQRASDLAGSIELRAAAPGRVVLVDDVATTGATLAACAAVLRAAGRSRWRRWCLRERSGASGWKAREGESYHRVPPKSQEGRCASR